MKDDEKKDDQLCMEVQKSLDMLKDERVKKRISIALKNPDDSFFGKLCNSITRNKKSSIMKKIDIEEIEIMMEICEEGHSKICYVSEVCPICEALEKIDDLEYDRPYYHQLITELTKDLEKHPDGYEGFCRCKYCIEYYEGDPIRYGCDCETCIELGYGVGEELDKNYVPHIEDDIKKLARYRVEFEFISTGNIYKINEIDGQGVITLYDIDDHTAPVKRFNNADFKVNFRVKSENDTKEKE